MLPANQPELAKTTYENLDNLAHLAGDPDPLANILTDLLGLQIQRRRSGAHWALDSDRQQAALGAARRWLNDRGYLDLPTTA